MIVGIISSQKQFKKIGTTSQLKKKKFTYNFRFDKEAKEWKERGVGIVKILKHPVKETFRVLLRREQVLKIAVNHAITKDIELKPMNT